MLAGARVLVVDDDEGILRLARKSLLRAGARVDTCTGVAEARALCSTDDDSMCSRCRCTSLKPVAITVIFTSSFIFSSSTAPKMMLASS